MTALVFRYIETIRVLIQFLIQITFKIHILYINILKYVYSVNILKYTYFIPKVMSVSFLATVDSQSANG